MGRNKNTLCPHNDGIICDGIAECDGCGWNPEVEKRRIQAIREARKPKPTFIRQSFVPGEHNQHWQKGGIR